MNLGDFAALVASRLLFPAMSLFSPRAAGEEDRNLRVYTNPLRQKILYRSNTLDKMVLWEQWRMRDYKDLKIKPGDVVVDIGGHIGTSTLDYSHHVGAEGTIYSIEALPENFGILNKNVRNNSITNVKTFNLAIVGDPNVSQIQLNTNPYNSGGHSVFGSGAHVQETVTCRATTLEGFIGENDIRHIDVLQMDVEGAEFDILLNADKRLLSSIPQIILEYHDAVDSGHDHLELLDLLHRLGFATREFSNFISRVFRLKTGIIYAWK